MMRRTIPALASMVLLAGCPRQALFVVLPNAEGGGVGAITVEDGKTATTLDQPYADGRGARRQHGTDRGKPRKYQRDLPARDRGAADPAASHPPLFHPRERRADPRVQTRLSRCVR